MTFKERIRVIFVCVVLEFGALARVPMRPDEIKALMETMNQPKLAHVIPGEDDEGEGPADE